MATEVNWTAAVITTAAGALAAATGDTVVRQASCTRYFAGGNGTNWCKHYAPGWVRAVRVRNLGTGVLYVSLGPALEGAASATQHCEAIPAGESILYALEGEAPAGEAHTTFSTWGADGASHAMNLVFEARP